MRRFVTLVSVILAGALSLSAGSIRDIDIRVVLDASGAARVTEVWDVNVTDGTEWYLVRDNLGDIRISDLSVSDETGAAYLNEGDWDVDRGIAQKAGRCGIVSKRNGCEICWGVGSYGRHTFTVSYLMSNVVKSLDDYDMLHVQFVSPGLSSAPKHVRLTISAEGQSFSDVNTRIWGFGYDGTMTFAGDGTVVAESDDRFGYGSSMIALMRFDKGMFAPASVQERPFQDVLDRAMDGADFSDEDSFMEKMFAILAMTIWILPVVLAIVSSRVKRRRILGCRMKDVTWSRDIPYDGNLVVSDYILNKLGMKRKPNAIASAMILDMINRNCLIAGRDAKGRVELSFNDDVAQNELTGCEKELYDMMRKASGSDLILQDKEFSRWSSTHDAALTSWTYHLSKEASNDLTARGYMYRNGDTPPAQSKARGLIGFQKYLSDFTLVKERHTQEVTLWKEYLVFAALFGIADKVASELKDIDPMLYQEVVTAGYDPDLIYMTRRLANSITNATTHTSSGGSSSGGFGGGASFGGGGGFSGGGFGGGSR